MNDIAIQAHNISKRYRLGDAATTGMTFREMICDKTRSVYNRLRKQRHVQAIIPEFWALNDVSFEVKTGEIVGIIGRNGAGKSTLLKILSRITDPTSGHARIRGRVGSLLEVGTGFHPELTGRENIYLNGAVLGMTKRQIDRKFDQIVDFAEVEQFLDTPVKRYSSGMYIRLAFAVAAHLEPEVLIVDEVLAVGDVAFQKKCLGRIGDVAKQGRTVLFVSHNITALRTLCTSAVLLDTGRLVEQGTTEHVINRYLQDCNELVSTPLIHRTDRKGDGGSRITSVTIENEHTSQPICSGCRLKVTLSYQSDTPLSHPRFLVGIYDMSNAGVYLLDSDAQEQLPMKLGNQGQIVCLTDPISLTPGRCYVNVALKVGGAIIDHVTHAATFDVFAGDTFGFRQMPDRDWVLCLLRQQWLASGEKAA